MSATRAASTKAGQGCNGYGLNAEGRARPAKWARSSDSGCAPAWSSQARLTAESAAWAARAAGSASQELSAGGAAEAPAATASRARVECDEIAGSVTQFPPRLEEARLAR